MQSTKFGYGNKSITMGYSGNTVLLKTKEPEKKTDPDKFRRDLAAFLERESPDLSDIAIVVADKTRLCGYPSYLPVLIRVLEDMGAMPGSISIYIAYGTHRPQSPEESSAAYGKIHEKYKLIHHNCEDKSLFVKLGKTSYGTPVLIRKDILKATFLVTFGAISHHYFAGYGGGRKLIFPGLGEKNTIYRNHGLFLDKKSKKLSLMCRAGELFKNPVALDLFEVEDFCPAHMAVHGILNSRGEVCDLLVGKGREHFIRACLTHGKYYETTHKDKFDLVIASCGGFPKDINFIQAHKSIDNAAKFVKDGGTLIIFAECKDGIGSDTFLKWFKLGYGRAFDILAENYEGNGGTALSMMEKAGRIKISMVTGLPADVVHFMGMKKTEPDHAIRILKNQKGSIAVIPKAGLLLLV